ncbi:MAG: hypothetical protein UX45_C0019G0001, partial [Candidatus Uhrbacteria bacterium GW2011_GWF2_46_218]
TPVEDVADPGPQGSTIFPPVAGGLAHHALLGGAGGGTGLAGELGAAGGGGRVCEGSDAAQVHGGGGGHGVLLGVGRAGEGTSSVLGKEHGHVPTRPEKNWTY